jgi:hypothetical protein
MAEGNTDVTLRMQNMVVMLTNRFDIGIIDALPASGTLIGILRVASLWLPSFVFCFHHWGEVERRIKDGILEFPTQPRSATPLRARRFDSA